MNSLLTRAIELSCLKHFMMSCTRQPSMSCKRTTIPQILLEGFLLHKQGSFLYKYHLSLKVLSFSFTSCVKRTPLTKHQVNKFWISKLLPYQHAFLCITGCFLKVLTFSFTPCVKRSPLIKDQIIKFWTSKFVNFINFPVYYRINLRVLFFSLHLFQGTFF